MARECARDGVDHPRYLLRLIELELIDRERRTVERRIRAVPFPAVKSLDTFDFAAIPSLNRMLVLELARSEHILRRENVIALGNSGTGKTHVALALGLAACRKGVTAAFTTAASLVDQILASERLTGAVPDRLTHHGSILTMNGDSYRLRQSAGRRRTVATAEQNQASDIVDPDTGEILIP